ncbi:hypothetical protein M3Y94_00036600 [Aphelenchoides besseyi]|nr:hypothetical protein M3Y94_00036600 [Aphelenchoides besseyi]KAI6219055.1 hypothetical protein M3Y95_01126200 [Aphelenchoides besseyi]
MRFIFALLFATTFVLLVNCQSSGFPSLEPEGMSEDGPKDVDQNDASNTKEAPNDDNNEQQPKEVGKGKGEELDGADGMMGTKDDKKGMNDGKKGVCEDRSKRCNKNNCKKAKLRSMMKRDCASTCGFCAAVVKGGNNGNTANGNTGKGNVGKGKAGKGRGGRRGRGRGRRGKRGGKKQQTKPKRGRGQPKKPKKQSEVQAR